MSIEVTTDLSDVSLPPGADTSGTEWQPATHDAPAYRLIWSPVLNAAEGIRAVVVQYVDGTIAACGEDAPEVYVGGSPHSPADAREIARALLKAADLAEQWASCTDIKSARADAKAVV